MKDANEVLRGLSGNIRLEEETHTYILKSNPDWRCISATTLLHHHFKKFDGPKIATFLIDKVPKYRGYTIDELLEEWKMAGVNGTRTHLQLENYIINRDPVDDVKALHGKAFLDTFIDRKDITLHPEVILYDRDLHIAGTGDLLVVDKDNKVHIYDWKTNKKITKYGRESGITDCTRHLTSCNYVQYSLQLSLYRWLLEQKFGLEVVSHRLIHLREDRYVAYSVPYLQTEIEMIIEDHMKHNVPDLALSPDAPE